MRISDWSSDVCSSDLAIGGLSVGEPKEDMMRILAHVTPRLPTEAPRYLMGVGTPEDLVEGVSRGVDMFDCVMPTRNARNGWLITRSGDIKLRNASYRDATRHLNPERKSGRQGKRVLRWVGIGGRG